MSLGYLSKESPIFDNEIDPMQKKQSPGNHTVKLQ